MKKIYLSCLALGLTFGSFAQIEIYKLGEDVDVSGTVVDVSNAESDPHQEFDVKNVSDATLTDLVVSRKKIEILAGTEDYLCWGLDALTGACYPASFVSPADPFITPDESNLMADSIGWLSTHHKTNGISGCAQYRYYVIDSDGNALDSVDVRYCSTVSVEEEEKTSISVYPNPANEVLNVKLDGNSIESGYQFKMFNVIGKEVMVKTLNKGTMTVDVGALPNGVYLYSIVKDSDIVETKKLVVRH